MSCDATDDRNFLACLTLLLIVASLWIFHSYLHYLAQKADRSKSNSPQLILVLSTITLAMT